MEAELLKCLRRTADSVFVHIVKPMSYVTAQTQNGYNVVYCTLTIDLLASRGVLLGRTVIMATSFQFSPLTFHKLVREQPSSQPSRININFYDASCFFIVVFKAYTKIGKRFSYRFSAFWLRSCVVSVLVSLTSGMLGIAWHQ